MRRPPAFSVTRDYLDLPGQLGVLARSDGVNPVARNQDRHIGFCGAVANVEYGDVSDRDWS